MGRPRGQHVKLRPTEQEIAIKATQSRIKASMLALVDAQELVGRLEECMANATLGEHLSLAVGCKDALSIMRREIAAIESPMIVAQVDGMDKPQSVASIIEELMIGQEIVKATEEIRSTVTWRKVPQYQYVLLDRIATAEEAGDMKLVADLKEIYERNKPHKGYAQDGRFDDIKGIEIASVSPEIIEERIAVEKARIEAAKAEYIAAEKAEQQRVAVKAAKAKQERIEKAQRAAESWARIEARQNRVR